MTISYNTPVTFGRNGSAKALNCTGIDFSEEGTQSWTSAPLAEMDIQLPPARQEAVIQIEATPYLVPDLIKAQQVFIYLGGMFVGFSIFTSYGTQAFPVNRNIISGRPIRLALALPNAMAPSAAMQSEDMRQLGIYLRSIVFKS